MGAEPTGLAAVSRRGLAADVVAHALLDQFAARLQVANTSDAPVLFFMEREQGHGAGRRLSDTVARYTRFYTFIEQALEVE